MNALPERPSPPPSGALTRSPRKWVFECRSHVEVMESFLAGKTGRMWTLGAWARRIGLSSSGTLVNIMKLRAFPSVEMAEKLATSMRFRPLEHEYFQLLVELERRRLDGGCAFESIERRLNALRKSVNTDYVDLERFSAISDPWFLVLREMTNLADFREDPNWFSRRTFGSLPAARVTAMVRTLEDSGLIGRDGKGRLRSSTPFQDTPLDAPGECLTVYHEKSIDLAREAIRSVPIPDRDISTSVISIRKAELPAIREFIHRMRDEFAGSFDRADGSADEVYQMNIQLFPVTRGRRYDV